VKAVAAALIIIVAGAFPAAAERLTIALSLSEVAIASNFTGAPITVFGVVAPDKGKTAAADYQVAVIVLGPTESVVERRKDRVAGIWVNSAAMTIGGAPSYYALQTSDETDALTSPDILKRLQIGVDRVAIGIDEQDPASGEFRGAYIHLKQKAGVYSENTDVRFLAPLIFRTGAFLPANTPVGRYTVLAYLFSGGDLVAHAQDFFVVTKSGLEGSIARFARGQSLAYGILSAALALFIGWAGGVIFRRD
jgi:uncharacterized protein (TIGR02186 family)